MHPFFDTTSTSLKVCGVTLACDAHQLVDLGIPALGINFWPKSKRYLAPKAATTFLPALQGHILRVGVFVNAPAEHVLELIDNNIIDVAQFHGDETPEYCAQFAQKAIPFIRAIGVKNADSLAQINKYQANAILLDAHAPVHYGGTGDTFDWTLASKFIQQHPEIPVLLAGGITADNAAEATEQVHPAALDLASGSESAPGIKDFTKIRTIKAAIDSAQ